MDTKCREIVSEYALSAAAVGALPPPRDLHDRVEIALYAAAVKAAPSEGHGLYSAGRSLSINRVGELDFATGARRLRAQYIKNIGSEDVAANTRQVRRRTLYARLLDEAGYRSRN